MRKKSTKDQAPGTREASSSRRQTTRALYSFEIWKLGLLWSLVFGIWCFASIGSAQPTSVAKLPAKDKLHLYLLMGQSNMAGRGEIGDEDKTSHPRVLVFRTNQWEAAVEPITTDKPKIKFGVGPGLAFGKMMADKTPGVTIGLVPCAVGGTPLSRWSKGGDLYSNAVYRARLTMRDGTLKGILWHQGESESGNEHNSKNYGERLAKMINDIRQELNSPDLPFVAGQIGEFLYTRKENKSPYARVVNEGIASIAQRVPNAGYTPSAGLTHKGDELHFDAASEREMGRRFAAEMLRLQKASAK